MQKSEKNLSRSFPGKQGERERDGSKFKGPPALSLSRRTKKDNLKITQTERGIMFNVLMKQKKKT